jgi:hypothetical protein
MLKQESFRAGLLTYFRFFSTFPGVPSGDVEKHFENVQLRGQFWI